MQEPTLGKQSASGVVLVTGGTGLVGKRIVSRLGQLGYSVRVLSRKQWSGEISGSIDLIRGDITDAKVAEAAVSGCEAVFHCAAELKVENKMPEVNVGGTRNVYTAAQKNRTRFFCHLSSVGVIGIANQRVVDENTPCNPMNAYERTKLEAEHIVEEGIEGCSSVILRPTNVFAEETISLDSYRGMGRRMRVWLTGKERSHLVYVADVVRPGSICWRTSPRQDARNSLFQAMRSREEPTLMCMQ
jgi:nucleoside-diphosphate-sugar epimerase